MACCILVFFTLVPYILSTNNIIIIINNLFTVSTVKSFNMTITELDSNSGDKAANETSNSTKTMEYYHAQSSYINVHRTTYHHPLQ